MRDILQEEYPSLAPYTKLLLAHLATENGSWFEYGIVIVVAITEATLLFHYVYRVIR